MQRQRPDAAGAMMPIHDAPTPALLIDRPRFDANCARMLAHVRSLGVRLRPHMKTLKSIEAARVAIDPAHGGIAVSTLKEAEYFADHDVEDIQLAVCVTPDKLPRAAAIAARIERFSLFVDNVGSASAIAAFAREQSAPFAVWIEIDSGDRRTGVATDDPALIEIACALDGVPIAGVATHAGRSYGERSPEAIAAVAEEERQAVSSAAERLREAGWDVPGVSAGSTPTARHARRADGLTELRAGVYMAGDLFQAAIGSIRREDMAVSVLASVISHKPEQGRIVIDAGGLALSKDRSTAAVEGGDMGYGLVADARGEARYGDLIVGGVHQEHGEIEVADAAVLAALPVGARVRVFPNHACMTTAMYDRYLLTDCDRLIGEWGNVGGW